MNGSGAKSALSAKMRKCPDLFQRMNCSPAPEAVCDTDFRNPGQHLAVLPDDDPLSGQFINSQQFEATHFRSVQRHTAKSARHCEFPELRRRPARHHQRHNSRPQKKLVTSRETKYFPTNQQPEKIHPSKPLPAVLA
jgi:hypothetical protein